MKITRKVFQYICNLQMCNDPTKFGPKMEEHFNLFLHEGATKFGRENWIEFFHFPNTCEVQEVEILASPLVFAGIVFLDKEHCEVTNVITDPMQTVAFFEATMKDYNIEDLNAFLEEYSTSLSQ